MYTPVKDGASTAERAYFDIYALFTEMWCAFIFCLVLLNVRNRATTFTGSKLLNYVTEALTLWWCLLVSNPMTNYSTVNPAIASGLAFTTALQSHHQWRFQFQYLMTWVFVVGPLLGAALAGLFW